MSGGGTAAAASQTRVVGVVQSKFAMRSTNTENEDNGPLAGHARFVMSVDVRRDDKLIVTIYAYDEMAEELGPRLLPGALVKLAVPSPWFKPPQPHPRMVEEDELYFRRRAGAVVLAPLDVREEARLEHAIAPWNCQVERGGGGGRLTYSYLPGAYPFDDDALRTLKRLHDDGVIDDDEFRQGKKKALGIR